MFDDRDAVQEPPGGDSSSRSIDEETRRQVEQYYAIFQDLVTRSREYARLSRYDAAAVYSQIAAKYAQSRHPGLFASPRLEQTLGIIGRTITGGIERRMNDTSPVREVKNVLHVFTQVAGIGGHTRMVWRWIGEDAGRSHSVAITRQGSLAIPSALMEAVCASHGATHCLDERSGGLLTWARDLRRFAVTADLIVLHMNPDDVIPILAFADNEGRPPIIYINHADQLFWLGASVADLVVNLRESGASLSQRRRGIPDERCALLPIALNPIQRTMSRREAKRRLGLEEETVVLLSIARPHKYLPLKGQGFVDVLTPVLEEHEHARLLVIGPEHTDQWERASRRTNGRIRALGLRQDTAVYYQAADIYVDSFPVISITSLLEAGSYGLPLLTRSLHSDQSTVLGADTPALKRCLQRVDAIEEYQSTLSGLIEDETLRLRLGEMTRHNIADVHTGAKWKQALENVYRLAAEVPPVAWRSDGVDEPRADEVDLLLPRLFAQEPDLDAIIQFNLRLLPIDLRWKLWLDMLRSRGTFRPGLLLPEWLATRLEKHAFAFGQLAHSAR